MVWRCHWRKHANGMRRWMTDGSDYWLWPWSWLVSIGCLCDLNSKTTKGIRWRRRRWHWSGVDGP